MVVDRVALETEGLTPEEVEALHRGRTHQAGSLVGGTPAILTVIGLTRDHAEQLAQVIRAGKGVETTVTDVVAEEPGLTFEPIEVGVLQGILINYEAANGNGSYNSQVGVLRKIVRALE